MKFIIHTFSLMLLLLLYGNCSKKTEKETLICDCNNFQQSATLENVEGVIKYDNYTDSWNIFYHEQQTYDNLMVLKPCFLDSKFQKENTRVILSGKVFETKRLGIPAGTTYSCIELTSINQF